MKESDGLFLIESRIMAKYAKHTNGVGSLIEVKSKVGFYFQF